MTAPRIREAGDAAFLIEFDPRIDEAVNAGVTATAEAVRAGRIAGVRDVVATFRSVAVHFDPILGDPDDIRLALDDVLATPVSGDTGRVVDVPVRYGDEFGPDLEAVASWAGCAPAEVVRMHSGRLYRVFMLGFLPGFPYLGTVDRAIAMPRRGTPRVHVPAGSVAVAGRQTGIYPVTSPGGWHILGRTSVSLFDATRAEPAWLRPGDHVRFVPMDRGEVVQGAAVHPPREGSRFVADAPTGRTITILRSGLQSTVQDLGRYGYQHIGVSVSGAMDRVAHVRANRLVGNPDDAATLEVTLVGPEVRCDVPTTVAVAGAELGAAIDGVPLPVETVARCLAGARLTFAGRRGGARSYIAFDGGIDAPPVLGSRSTHLAARLGPLGGRAIRAGDRLPLGAATQQGRQPRMVVAPVRTAEGHRVRVVPGPQGDWFPPAAFERLGGTRFTLTSQSNRMGYRLAGAMVPRLDAGEMISDATVAGAVQVPPSGEPIVLMADRQTTGGYPQIAVVIAADLPLLGQMAPGDWLEFEWCSFAQARRANAVSGVPA